MHIYTILLTKCFNKEGISNTLLTEPIFYPLDNAEDRLCRNRIVFLMAKDHHKRKQYLCEYPGSGSFLLSVRLRDRLYHNRGVFLLSMSKDHHVRDQYL